MAAGSLRFHQSRGVTLDINPEAGMDAVRLFESMRAESRDCEVAVIIGTGFSLYRDMFRGVIGFFAKPINFQEIAATLCRYFPELKRYKPDRAL